MSLSPDELTVAWIAVNTDLRSIQIHPVPGNRLLVRVDQGARNKLYLLGADGMILYARTEPATLHSALLLPPADD
jgi:hypothetical protein